MERRLRAFDAHKGLCEGARLTCPRPTFVPYAKARRNVRPLVELAALVIVVAGCAAWGVMP